MSASTSSAYAHTNNLIHATSPYLLQHAHNPVDWHVWSKYTLDLAKREGKMIFLSSGYSACHWCHVMAHESFEDEKIAAELNEHFVCVKIDREERPDIDAAYMSFIQATSGRGGWPMSVFLTPDALPLFGGTYFPPPMFTDLIERLATLWTTDRERCLASASDITAQLRQVAQAGIAGTDWQDLPPLSSTVGKALKHWLVEFDETEGGFGSAPKFPSPPNTFHLLHSIVADAHKPSLAEAGFGVEATRKALEASAFTLVRIARGGITDHLAGGIARYSVDAEWRVPHYEKMLYDQGQLLSAYAEAIQLCESSDSDVLKAYVPEFQTVLRGIVEYLQRDMCSPDGSLYAAEDADSLPSAGDTHAKEGAFYVWDATEVEDIVRGVGGKDDTAYRVLSQHFGLKLDGNIPSSSDPHGELVGKNMLHASASWSETASKLRMSEEEVGAIWKESRAKLLAVRQRRPRPMRDDKIITAWNALAISGLAKTVQVLAGRPECNDVAELAITMAKRAADFLWRTMWDAKAHRFLRSYRNGVCGPLGFDVDHAFFVQAMLDLHAVTFDGTYVQRAVEAQASQDALFWDNSGVGGYLISSVDGDGNVWTRQRGDQDGAEPTSTSVSAHNLLRLSALIGDIDQRIATISQTQHKRAPPMLTCRERAAQCIGSGGLILNRAPFALGMLVTALLRARLGPVQCIIVGASDAHETQALLHAAQQRRYAPRTAIILINVASDGTLDAASRERLGDALASGNHAVRSVIQDASLLKRAANHAFAMVCQDFTCGLPVTDPDQLVTQLLGQ